MAKRKTDYKAKALATAEKARRSVGMEVLPLSLYASDEQISPKRAAGIGESISDWLLGNRIARLVVATSIANAMRPGAGEEAAFNLASANGDFLSNSNAESYRSRGVTWVDRSFGELLVAATERLRNDSETRIGDHRFSPSGVIVFGENLDDALALLETKDTNAGQVRAITWRTISRFETVNSDQDLLVVEAWGRLEDESETDDVIPTGSFMSLAFECIKYGSGPRKFGESKLNFVWMVAALESVAASTRVQRIERPEPPTPGTKPNRNREPNVRQLSLIRIATDDGIDPELAAALGRTSRQGGVRLHWVRGHWTRQWYPSKERHLRRWIDGYARGNPDKGVVTTPAVRTARLNGREVVTETED